MSKRKKKIQTTNKHTVDAKPTDNLVSVLDFTLLLLRRSKTPIKGEQRTSHGEVKTLILQ